MKRLLYNEKYLLFLFQKKDEGVLQYEEVVWDWYVQRSSAQQDSGFFRSADAVGDFAAAV